MVFMPKSCTLLFGELNVGSGEVPMDDDWLCASEEEPGDSVFETLEPE